MLLIQNGMVCTMEAEGWIQADILIKHGKIAKIEKGIQVTEGMEVLNAEGLQVFPGFIDAHSHIGISQEKITGIGAARGA